MIFSPTIEYLLHLADNSLILAQVNSQWCGHAPILEEDLAMANISLDLFGQARLLFQLVSSQVADGRTEDTLAYWRNAPEFRNFTLLELPHSIAIGSTSFRPKDYAVSLVRNFLFSSYMSFIWRDLRFSKDVQLAEIASKSLKENHYHLTHTKDWLHRLCHGTDQSLTKIQQALDFLWPFTQEFWTPCFYETQAFINGLGTISGAWKPKWQNLILPIMKDCHLTIPPTQNFMTTGKNGVHSEHLSLLLAEMQSVARAYPGVQW